MADIVDFLAEQEKKSKKDLISYCAAQYSALQLALSEVKKLEEKISHLEEMLKHPVETIIKSPEQATVENQIGRFTELAMARQLTNEEIKSLDILIKNKMLLNGQPTTIPGEVKKKKELSDAQLVNLARIEKKE